ncbi:MAG: chorismate-binding protein, partial [Actinomycetales bacterium]|nr:chorismate-binding protein [Actinomycetales bacterium]
MSANSIDLDQFRQLAKNRRVIPVIRRVTQKNATAIGLYQTLAQQRPGTFLLESAEHGLTWSRYSFVGVHTSTMLSEINGETLWSGRVPEAIADNSDPLEVLRDLLTQLHTPDVNLGISEDELPPLTGGVVGYLGYEIVRRIEKLPAIAPDVLQVPELAMFLATDLAIIDHVADCVFLVANAINYDNTAERVDLAWEDAIARLDQMEERLANAEQPIAFSPLTAREPLINRETDSTSYRAAVEVAKEHIRAGDAFQIVLSQRFSTPCPTSALSVYQALRESNPSPYMFLIRVPKQTGPGLDFTEVAFDLVGSSPEALVRLTKGQAMLHPI